MDIEVSAAEVISRLCERIAVLERELVIAQAQRDMILDKLGMVSGDQIGENE
ncbi:hypothetical protein [Trueperella pyogenes]|uniref:hypothetical protein n=1 Tax=Trueperella pyogenes TaxID=1661 RepID=UPI0032480DB8